MMNPFLGDKLPAIAAHLPAFGLLLVVVPLVSIVTIKLWLATRSTRQRKGPTQFLVLGERDANGVPLLATSVARSSESEARQAFEIGSRLAPRRR